MRAVCMWWLYGVLGWKDGACYSRQRCQEGADWSGVECTVEILPSLLSTSGQPTVTHSLHFISPHHRTGPHLSSPPGEQLILTPHLICSQVPSSEKQYRAVAGLEIKIQFILVQFNLCLNDNIKCCNIPYLGHEQISTIPVKNNQNVNYKNVSLVCVRVEGSLVV